MAKNGKSSANGTAAQLVRYSRAGDVFHYRWAARRCLRLIHPHSPLKCVTIEGSRESKRSGEYAIDLAEYSETEGCESIAYFQLKHTTTRTRKVFTQNELAATLKAFAQRYNEHFPKSGKPRPVGSVTFSFVTNRPVSDKLKKSVVANASGSKASQRSQQYLERTTGLRDRQLQAFCASLSFVDGEGDYILQKQRLKSQMSEYIAGFVDSQEVDALIAMVADRALPKSEDGRSNGEIFREDVLQRLGVSSEGDLFPAPAEFETLPHAITREQHKDILKHIISAKRPVIIHAGGGVGKSVVARQIAQSLPKGSQGFVYDCFGGGKYRNPSAPRHRACDALVQLANEMAERGLCRPLIGHANRQPDAIFRAFFDRLRQASESLQEATPGAVLLIAIDAADNAELAARENADKCFAHGLLGEEFPPGCRLAMFCRTERIELLKPKAGIKPYELRPFSEKETAAHLRQLYTDASDRDCLEFHRLTGGNPRVQANALSQGKSVEDVLLRLGPSGTTVAAQIASQLDTAISVVKERHVDQEQVDAICRGLANLPPFVPVEVLARAAGVDVSAVYSFVSDLGWPLWHTDDAVQFRDEPTETWFRQRFGAEKEHVLTYLDVLEPLAKKYTYVAKVLPQLLLKCESYDRLVRLALSDDFLPENNAIDQRDIRSYRLQFAFRAALRLRRFADAVRLAFRAGEEAAGKERQLSLLQANLHLIAPLQGPHRIQELAYRRAFAGAWEGSQNVFSGSLLSSVKDFHGEARSYLRAAQKWLDLYFAGRAKRDKEEKPRPIHSEELQDSDIAELSWARLNLLGPSEAVRFLLGWRPPEVVFRVTRLLIRRLVDAARFDEIDEIARKGAQSIHLMVGVADELLAVARFPPRDALRCSLGLLAGKATRIPKPQQFPSEDALTPAILSLVEASIAERLSRKNIRAVLNFYIPFVADRRVGSNAREESRRTFLRGAALRAVVEGKQEVAPRSLLPLRKARKTGRGKPELSESDERDITQCIDALLPWYVLRARLLAADAKVSQAAVEHARELSERTLRERYHSYEPLRWEISRVTFELLALDATATSSQTDAFINFLKETKTFSLKDRLDAARAVFRLPHLQALREPLEMSCRETIKGPGNEGPEERADWFVSLAKAVLTTSIPDAAAYFNQAVEAVSKFGDEMVERWEALVAVARRASEGPRSTPQTTYRFVRCAEIIGETVAREKYWDRDEVFRVAVHLDGPSAFAALSRWRDRGVGSFRSQLEALSDETVRAGLIAPCVAWCLSGFEGCNASARYAVSCAQQETRKSSKQRILDAAVRDLDLAGTSLAELRKLELLADSAQLSKARLAQLIEAYESATDSSVPAPGTSTPPEHIRLDRPQDRIAKCLDGLDLFSSGALGKGLEKLRRTEPPYEFDLFWKLAVGRIPRGRETEFLRVLLSAAELDFYDIREAVNQVRTAWLKRAAVSSQWRHFLEDVGKRLAVPLASRGGLSFFRSEAHFAAEETAGIIKGVIDGLAESSDLTDASTFFGFIRHVVGHLSTDEASDLLDYSLGRFEEHIDDDHGDGPWSEWLRLSGDVSAAVVAMVWSALGSPYSSTRWEAAHCVTRLGDGSCEHEIAALLGLMQAGGVGPFGSHRFPFYELHAKLYLLLALARVAVDDPTILRPHVSIFQQVALEGMPHILIQKTAADIAIKIERAFPGAYGADVVADLRRVGRSQMPARVVEGYSRGHDDLGMDLYFGYDFEKYWLQPLGEVFGISRKDVVDLARGTATRTLGIPGIDRPKDARQSQWEWLSRFEGGYNTWHDHGSYPSVDNYTFYYSYHSCLAVASELLAKTPVVRHGTSDYEENPWEDWLSDHLLTRSDGKWLSDRRDPKPIMGRSWVNASDYQDWEWGIRADDFAEMVRPKSSLRGSLCVSGHWVECDISRTEEIHVASALVDRANAEAIATDLRLSDETFWSALPQFESDESGASDSSPALTGWIRHYDYRGERLDSFDPYAGGIRYPPREIAPPFISMLSLSPDSERREWRLPNSSDPSAICEVWSEKRLDQRDRPYPFGERIQASVGLLLMLCKETGKDLLFEVRIRRRINGRFSASEDGMRPVLPSRKLFLLSSEGLLRDKHVRYQLKGR